MKKKLLISIIAISLIFSSSVITAEVPTEKENEIVIDHNAISDKNYKFGDKIRFAPTAGKNDITDSITSLEYTVVGTVESPLYISYQRGTTDIGNGKLSKYMYIPSENIIKPVSEVMV
jgi:putative ABC transport system permease protein